MTFREWLKRPEVRGVWTIKVLAEQLRRNRVSVSRMANGHSIPRPDDVLEIFRLTEGAVGPDDWYPEVRRERTRRRDRERFWEARRAWAAQAGQVQP
jgi:hypothetical protein